MEMINEYFATPNLPATVLLILVTFYWLLTIVGATAMDSFDIDFDFDTDIDGDMPGAHGLEGAGSILGMVFAFFYLGRIPLMILVSVFSLVFWLGSVYLNRQFNPELNAGMTLITFPVYTFASLLVTKILLWPTLGFFDQLQAGHKEKPNRLLGLHGTVTSSVVDEKFGQVTIEQNGPPIVLNVFCGELDRFTKGDVVTLVEYNPDKNTYLIAPYAEKK